MNPALSAEPRLRPSEQSWRNITVLPRPDRLSPTVRLTDYVDALDRLGQSPDEAISIYIHLPFCAVRCLYCGCNTTITHSSERIDRYLDHLAQEMDLVVQRIGSDRDLLQLHFGGGTPNYLNDSQLVRLMEMVSQRFRILGETDSSIECHPRRASAGQLSLLRGLGFRRISFGVQDLQPEVQRAIGRVQSLEMVEDVYGMARDAGFEYINLDLIYGLPEQTLDSFGATLDAVIGLGPDRVSCYPYTHTPDLHPHQHAIDAARLPSSLDRLAFFHRAVDRFAESGYTWIGLDTFVLDTDELAIAQEEARLHLNGIGYTPAPTRHLMSFGLGGVTETGSLLVNSPCSMKDWQDAIGQRRLPMAQGRRLDPAQQQRREAIIGLICNLEIPIDLAALGLPKEFARVAQYAKDGLVQIDGDRLSLTDRGRYFVHALCIDPQRHLRSDEALWPLLRNL
ncbi:oxygen-independent coproporphyrinogen III oxidase [Thioalkalicoccus limnaeus]|uniref:Coproporphyrinogen-III oxidase n=1 Tax=Thioalkalicoccus limnaeus TaxID=120681 RepID=A0ABV4BHF2_9GAMM